MKLIPVKQELMRIIFENSAKLSKGQDNYCDTRENDVKTKTQIFYELRDVIRQKKLKIEMNHCMFNDILLYELREKGFFQEVKISRKKVFLLITPIGKKYIENKLSGIKGYINKDIEKFFANFGLEIEM